jgi:hypothetical protein
MNRSLWLPLLLLASSLPFPALARAEPPTEPGETVSRLFQPPRRATVPALPHGVSSSNPIDAFILARLSEKGLTLSRPADPLRWLRRVTFDLTGLPPTAQEMDDFAQSAIRNPQSAMEAAVDRLLASPRYGERWATPWLDLVRYAESDGFKADDLRPNAHRYRDYVIRALNADLPYDRFIRQQLAGDELEPDNPEALLATGFLRLWPDEYNAANLEQRRQEILDDITDTTGLAFLGLTVGCARCHDHKYDPFPQSDYFRLQAFFAPLLPRDDLVAATPAARAEYRKRLAAWEDATREIRAEMERLTAEKREQVRRTALEKFRAEIQQAVRISDERRTPYQKQIAAMAEKQLHAAEATVVTKLPAEGQKRYKELEVQLAAVPGRPEPLPGAMAVSDVGSEGPPTHRLLAGDWHKPREKVEAGFPGFLGATPVERQLPEGVRSAGLRAALARWLTRKDHPLTARVMVNRLWQQHFGVGLVPTASDFGLKGDPVSHPELLDWLAVEFVERGWSLKQMHRLMVTSAAYCQDSRVDPEDPAHKRALRADPDNRLLWHARRRRLEGEAIRDAQLALAGDLNLRMFGPSARPRLPDKISKYAWTPDIRVEDQNRRSVYVQARRNMRFPLFDAFDLPDMHNSCARRVNTTTAPQALQLLNGAFTRERARHLASTLLARHGDDDNALVGQAYRLAWGRPATANEIRLGVRFLSTQTQRLRAENATAPARSAEEARTDATADLCQAILISNEFLYVD